MVKIAALLTLTLLILGCSNSGGIMTPDIKGKAKVAETQDNHWNWGVWEFRFNEDHTQVEAVPVRGGQYHYCITKLMEVSPCSYCLVMGKPAVQPDGTVKLNVTLRHPFPSAPMYTGFDVRGMVYFPPGEVKDITFIPYKSTLYPGDYPLEPLYKTFPLIYSKADQGGGELLNADGYSCYLIPGAEYSTLWPIFSYAPPKYSNEPAPFSTINPYRLFASDSERRMFLVSDIITREYHFALPPGPFNFGYAVDASWWAPTKTPVTNPAIDFPREANAEDPWLVEYEQLQPISKDNIGQDIIKVTLHHRGFSSLWYASLWFWDELSTDDPKINNADFGIPVQSKIDDFTTVGYFKNHIADWWEDYGGGLVPGHHCAVLFIYENVDIKDPYRELLFIVTAKIVDVYVEG